MNQNISDRMFVLSRTEYGETDRILNILTENNGKLSTIAKGVRSSKSKLAGGIELFAENKVVVRSSKSDMYILTSARMENYYGDLAKNIEAASYIYEVLKMINKFTPVGEGSEFYNLLKHVFLALKDQSINLTQVKIWFGLQYLKHTGSLPNLLTDQNKQKLSGNNFSFDFDRQCFFAQDNGIYTSETIKVIRQLEYMDKPKKINGVNENIEQNTLKLLEMLQTNHS